MVMLQQAVILSLAFAIMTAATWIMADSNVKKGLRDLFADGHRREIAEMQQLIRAHQSSDAVFETAGLSPSMMTQLDLISPGLWGIRDNQGSIAGSFRRSVFDTYGLYETSKEELLLPFNQLRQDDYLYGDAAVPVWLILVESTQFGDFAVAAPIYDLAQYDLAVPRAMLLSGIVIVLITLSAGVVFGLRFHARLDVISDGMKRVASGDFSVRVSRTNTNDDLDDLAENIDETTKRLEVAMTQLNNMSRNIAHDLKTPLARLRSRLESTAGKCEETEDDILDAIGEVDSIITIFDTISRISKIEAGGAKTGFKIINLGDVAQTIAENFGPVIEDSGHAFTVDVVLPAEVMGDARMIEQAVANFIQNALRYSEPQTPIALKVVKNVIAIENEGVGIPEHEHERVQRPMVRLDSARSSEGSGLGLAMVRAIAQLHGATVRFEALHSSKPSGLRAMLEFDQVEFTAR
jgi:signal transduction histidine kinase